MLCHVGHGGCAAQMKRTCCRKQSCPTVPAAVPPAPRRPRLPLQLSTKASPFLFHRGQDTPLAGNCCSVTAHRPGKTSLELCCSRRLFLPKQLPLLAGVSPASGSEGSPRLLLFPSLNAPQTFPPINQSCMVNPILASTS